MKENDIVSSFQLFPTFIFKTVIIQTCIFDFFDDFSILGPVGTSQRQISALSEIKVFKML